MVAGCGSRTHATWCRLVVPALLLIAAPRMAVAVGITGYSSAVNDRFSGGYPTAPVTNTSPSFIGLGYDWLGVGWAANDATKSFGFISPRHYLVARHYGGAATIEYLAADGSVGSATQAGVTNTGYGLVFSGQTEGDLSIGRLTAPIPRAQGLPRYGVLDINASSTVNSSYDGLTLTVTGRGPNGTSSTRIGQTPITGTVLSGNDSYVVTGYGDVQLQVGDSGSPDFIMAPNANGDMELTILGNNAGTDFSTVNAMNYLANSTVMGAVNAITNPDGYALKMVGFPVATWQGGGGGPTADDLFVAANWTGGSVPTDQYAALGTAASTRSLEVESSGTLRGLAFQVASGSGFTLTGPGTLSLGRGGLTNYDPDRQTVLAAVALTAPQYWNVGPGGITVHDVATGGFLLEIDGAGTGIVTGSISGTGGVALSGSGLTLSGSNSYTGGTWVHDGTLVVTGASAASSGVQLDAPATLAGTGSVATISGAGTVGPGMSPGILTAPAVQPAGGLDFAFEFTRTGGPDYGQAAASGNDLLRLTAATPFATPLSAANVVGIYFDVATLTTFQMYEGGFFTDRDQSFLAEIDDATFAYYLRDAAGGTTYNGVRYSPYTGPFTFEIDTVPVTAAFAGGSEAGFVTRVFVVPEPGGLPLVGLGGLAALVMRARYRAGSRRGRPAAGS